MQNDNSIAGLLISIGITILIIVVVFSIFNSSTERYNTETHADDIVITEWISPDGVHYWYQQAGYHAMLAPRYDANGELVIDKK